ncbi:MAG: efflux RND transporter permease subunit [Rickettsiales bacterium]
MSLFFIQRPVFAWVIAIIVMLAGLLSMKNLPIEQYPTISPPSVSIQATYPGASSKIIEDSVTQVIERNLIGIDNLRYISSNSDSAGLSAIDVVFEPGTDPDIAQVQVQNKVQGAMSRLPAEVQKFGVTVTKNSLGFLLVAGFYSTNPNATQSDIGDVINNQIRNPLARVNGVGKVQVFGASKAMRIWLNPHRMNEYQLTTKEIKHALEVQNNDVSSGQLGGLPATKDQQINVSITTQSRLRTADQFKNIILRVNEDGSQVRLRDVARVELGANDYDALIRYNGRPASGIGVSLVSGANALDTAVAVKEKLKDLMQFVPKDIKLVYPFDSTPFIKLAIKEVAFTLLEALILVFAVMFLFLQSLRATFIPAIAVPVVLLGTLALLYAFGFSINELTMFAMVLAIGLLVDDAIVVVENVERVMREENLSPVEATKKSMSQITDAIVGIAVVLSAVFIPMMFFKGSAGVVYKQFSFTIAAAMGLSVGVALILSPCLCATMLLAKPHQSSGFFAKFNEKFDILRSRFIAIANKIIDGFRGYILVYILLIGVMIFSFLKIPTSFLPNEDKGVMYLMLSTPPGSTIQRTLNKVQKVEDYFLNKEKGTVDHLFTVTGYSFTGQAQNVALGFVGLSDWEKRESDHQSVFNLAKRSMQELGQLKDTFAFAFYPPPIPELEVSSGFNLQIIDNASIGHEKLMKVGNEIISKGSKHPKLQAVRLNGLYDVPQFKVNIDHEKAGALGLSISDINDTLQTAWGSSFINNFIDKGRVKRVYVQSDAPFRMMPDDISHWYVKNNKNQMVPLDGVSNFKWTYGSPKLERYNGASSINIQGSAIPGISSGESMDIMENIVKDLPFKVDYAWTGLSYEERLSSNQTLKLYSMSVLAVFLCLAALYESWRIPFSVLLAIPLGIIGAILAALLFRLSNDIYFQVALATTIGLASKNAILIVEFAKTLHEQGKGLKEAALESLKIRFRPIIMTSMAFILGVSPLAFSSGIGSVSQNAIGISVIGGMLSATFIAILFVPMFFVLINRFKRKKDQNAGEALRQNSPSEQ